MTIKKYITDLNIENSRKVGAKDKKKRKSGPRGGESLGEYKDRLF